MAITQVDLDLLTECGLISFGVFLMKIGQMKT